MKFTIIICCLFFHFIPSNIQSDKIKAIQVILNFEEFNNYLHPEIKERSPYILLKNKYFSENSKIYINSKQVLFKNKIDIKDRNYLEIKNFDCQGDNIYFSIFYSIENIEFKGCLTLREDKWLINNYDIIVY
ncbi:hypothetical protein [Leeuwenhoekiella marinoflava]|uniref:Uncharacterized protein n=2 Tax=Leeuwenhoekiella marinoflava TaxID=988 RepID=A0A4Q0PN04_9FLAO|nr:hypothetical protein [Leeuwenhoekiella marinoflava]RXG31857.1 hypothetical protein DSL99_1681 [Leeuwenhoekiella marinoflava]SHF02497.1 hypothetical protein SAMN02745246_01501 [Leeuwenhoekiella marinoflava DSM 3653]